MNLTNSVHPSCRRNCSSVSEVCGRVNMQVIPTLRTDAGFLARACIRTQQPLQLVALVRTTLQLVFQVGCAPTLLDYLIVIFWFVCVCVWCNVGLLIGCGSTGAGQWGTNYNTGKYLAWSLIAGGHQKPVAAAVGTTKSACATTLLIMGVVSLHTKVWTGTFASTMTQPASLAIRVASGTALQQ